MEQQVIYIKDIIEVYIKRMVKYLKLKIFKHYLYIEYYIIALEFVHFIRIDKTTNMIFNKELRIIKRYLMVKDQKRIQNDNTLIILLQFKKDLFIIKQ